MTAVIGPVDRNEQSVMTANNYFDTIAKRLGWNYDNLRAIDEVSEKTLDGMSNFIGGLKYVLNNNIEITVWPDYDMDGLASGTIFYAGLAELGFTVNMIIPDYTGSRALEPRDVDHIMEVYPNTGAIITCDGGINSHAGLDYAKSLHLLTFVTDHHTEEAPGCNAHFMVNPNGLHSTYDHRDICGAQVAYMTVTAYAATYAPAKYEDIRQLRLFAGIGALADVMPLVHQSRQDVRKTLTQLGLLTPAFPLDRFGRIDKWARNASDAYSSALITLVRDSGEHHPYYVDAFSGVADLLNELGFAGSLYNTDIYDEKIIGFTIAPMFNATRRIEADMALNVAVFTPSVVEHYAQIGKYPEALDASRAVRQLIENNNKRKRDTRHYTAMLESVYQEWAPFIYVTPEPIPAGFLGLLATNMLNTTGSPAVMVVNQHNNADGSVSFSGSARAADGVSIFDLAAQVPGFEAHGHPQACGVRMDTESVLNAILNVAIDAFAVQDDETAPDFVTGELNLLDVAGNRRFHLQKDLVGIIDHSMNTDEIIELVDDLEMMRPFGKGFDYPTITVTVDPAQCIISTMSGGKHSKVITPSGFVMLKWNTMNTDFGSVIEDAMEAGDFLQFTVEAATNMFQNNLIAQGIIQEVHRVRHAD